LADFFAVFFVAGALAPDPDRPDADERRVALETAFLTALIADVLLAAIVGLSWLGVFSANTVPRG